MSWLPRKIMRENMNYHEILEKVKNNYTNNRHSGGFLVE